MSSITSPCQATVCVCACAYTNLDLLRSPCCRLHVVQLHVEQEEDEAVQSRTQTVTQASDTCDHALGHTCARAHTHYMRQDNGRSQGSEVSSHSPC